MRGDVIGVHVWDDDGRICHFRGITTIAADDADDFGADGFRELERISDGGVPLIRMVKAVRDTR